MRVLVVSIAAFILTPVKAEGQAVPSTQTAFQKWISEDVFWIVSSQERADFNRLRTDAQRALFIEDFWARRDPTPGTPENEFRMEHYRRIQWANDHYSTTNWPGWKSDRGMMYIRFGAPDEKEEHPDGSAAAYPYERWHYRYMEGVGRDVIMEFVDKTRSNEYQLTWDPAEKQALLRVPGQGRTLYEQMGLSNKR